MNSIDNCCCLSHSSCTMASTLKPVPCVGPDASSLQTPRNAPGLPNVSAAHPSNKSIRRVVGRFTGIVSVCTLEALHQRRAGQRVSVCAACIACIDILLIALHKTEAVVVTLSPKTQTTGTLKKCEDKHAKPKCRRHLRINERPMESHQETNKEELLQCSTESAVPH